MKKVNFLIALLTIFSVGSAQNADTANLNTLQVGQSYGGFKVESIEGVEGVHISTIGTAKIASVIKAGEQGQTLIEFTPVHFVVNHNDTIEIPNSQTTLLRYPELLFAYIEKDWFNVYDKNTVTLTLPKNKTLSVVAEIGNIEVEFFNQKHTFIADVIKAYSVDGHGVVVPEPESVKKLKPIFQSNIEKHINDCQNKERSGAIMFTKDITQMRYYTQYPHFKAYIDALLNLGFKISLVKGVYILE